MNHDQIADAVALAENYCNEYTSDIDGRFYTFSEACLLEFAAALLAKEKQS